VPLNRDGSYGNGPVDWSVLSSENVERIEIYRGAGPAKFGNTMGGVVNIITRKPSQTPDTVVNTSYGSMDTWDSSIVHSWKAGVLGWALSAGHFESDGYLRNNTMDRNNFSALMTLDLPARWQIGGGVDYSDKENGNPVYNRPDSPYYNRDEPDADSNTLGGPGIDDRLIDGNATWGDGTLTQDENLNMTAFLEKKGDQGSLRLDYRLWNQDRTETFYDAADSSRKIYERETEAEDGNWSLQAAGLYQLGDHRLEAGGETKRYGWGAQAVTHIDRSYFNGSINSPYFAFVSQGFEGQPDIMAYHALYAQDTWSVHPDLTVEVGLRQEWFDADSIDPEAFGYEWEAQKTDLSENHIDPRLAVTYHPFETAALSARFGIAHRYPTSPEYFWWYLNNAAGYFNTDFKSEAAAQYELAYLQAVVDTVELTLRGYYYDIDDYITSTRIQGVGSVYYNIGDVTIKGLEAGFSARLPLGLRAWANVTWQDGEKADDPWDTQNRLEDQLPDFPETMANAGVDYQIGPFKARAWMNYVGEREHFDGDTRVELDSYTLLNVSAGYRALDTERVRLDMELTAENLLDEDYEEEEGYPMPGVMVVGGIRLQF
jgi:outer membrane receptor protein involved in Fe transport